MWYRFLSKMLSPIHLIVLFADINTNTTINSVAGIIAISAIDLNASMVIVIAASIPNTTPDFKTMMCFM